MTALGKAALVTGAARRIGRAIALDLAAAGWDIAVHYHTSEAEAREVARAIEGLGRRASLLAADLGVEAEVADLVARAAGTLGPLTLLVNNAAIFGFDRPETADRSSWNRHLDINLRAPLVLTQGLLAQLPGDARANVVNLIDQRVWNPTPNYTSYTISKAGLWALTRHLALALAPRVRVNAIGPGVTLPSATTSPQDFAAMWQAMPLGRGTTPEEICAALRFILDAPALTGQMIVLDGGQHLGWLTPGQLPGAG